MSSLSKFSLTKQFTSENSALVLIDYQVGTLQLVRSMSSDVSLRNACLLAQAAKAYGMPVVLTTSQEDEIQGPLAPALQNLLPDAYKHRVKRAGIVNAWSDPKFVEAVEATGRKNLIMAGVTTDICLIFPSMSAVQEGFEVQPVMDASGSSYSRECANDAASSIARSCLCNVVNILRAAEIDPKTDSTKGTWAELSQTGCNAALVPRQRIDLWRQAQAWYVREREQFELMKTRDLFSPADAKVADEIAANAVRCEAAMRRLRDWKRLRRRSRRLPPPGRSRRP